MLAYLSDIRFSGIDDYLKEHKPDDLLFTGAGGGI